MITGQDAQYALDLVERICVQSCAKPALGHVRPAVRVGLHAPHHLTFAFCKVVPELQRPSKGVLGRHQREIGRVHPGDAESEPGQREGRILSDGHQEQAVGP